MNRKPIRYTRLLSLGSLLLAFSACVRLAGSPDEFTCLSDSGCAEGEICLRNEISSRYNSNGVCRPEGSCFVDYSCATDELCINEKCTTVECTSRDESACGGYTCRDDTCGTECTISLYDCQDDHDNPHHCVDGACVPNVCTNDLSCPDGFACRDDGKCETSCGYSNDNACQEGYYCDFDCLPKLPLGAPCDENEECLSEDCELGECVEPPPELECVGTPNECERRTLDDCEAAGDCRLRSTNSCVGRDHTLDCEGTDARTGTCPLGCSEFLDNCSLPVDCIEYNSSFSCENSGCTWAPNSCTGTADESCADFTSEACESVPGCSLIESR